MDEKDLDESALDENALTLREAIHDESFRELLCASGRAAMTWNSFLRHPLPPRMSPLSAWDAIEELNECTGITLFPNQDQELMWYRRTRELSDLLDAIMGKVSKGALLYRSLLDRSNRALVLSLRLSEAVSAARLSGLGVDTDYLEMHVRLGSTPETSIERLVSNAINLDVDLPTLVDQDFSGRLLIDFYRRLVEGIGPEKEEELHARFAGRAIDEQAWLAVRKRMDLLLAYADQKYDGDSAVLKGAFLADVVRFHQSFGFASGLIGSLVARLFYLKHELPVLALVPLSSVQLRWLRNELDGRMVCTPEEYESTCRHTNSDLTVHHTLSAQCILLALKEAASQARGASLRGSEARAALSGDARFNHRQRSILARALSMPCAEFRIRYHQEKHLVSYATARRDLVELAEAGYLRSEHRGRALVFVVGERIGELADGPAPDGPLRR